MDNDRGQSLITKYVWVIETIYRRRKISFKELNELWLFRDKVLSPGRLSDFLLDYQHLPMKINHKSMQLIIRLFSYCL